MIYIYLILVTHFICDFIFQTNYMALNKSKSNAALFDHVIVYTGGLFIMSILFTMFNLDLQYYFMLVYPFINGIFHFITDYFTSRWTAKLYAQNKIHEFFCVIGFDQLIHACTLIGTYQICQQLL